MRTRLMGQRGQEHGFTLPELMIVVLIIGILIAIGLPTFLGAHQRAEDRGAQTDLRSGLVSALTYYTQSGSFTGFDVTAAQAAENSLSWVGGGAPLTSQISIVVASGSDLNLATLSKSGTYFCLAQQAGAPATDRGRSSTFTAIDTVAECTGGW